jgi:hypothetical protein
MLKRKIPNYQRKIFNFSDLPRAAFAEYMAHRVHCNIPKNRKLWASVILALHSVTRRKPKQKYREKLKRPPQSGGLKIIRLRSGLIRQRLQSGLCQPHLLHLRRDPQIR